MCQEQYCHELFERFKISRTVTAACQPVCQRTDVESSEEGRVARRKKTSKLLDIRLQFDTTLPVVFLTTGKRNSDMSEEANRWCGSRMVSVISVEQWALVVTETTD